MITCTFLSIMYISAMYTQRIPRTHTTPGYWCQSNDMYNTKHIRIHK